MQRRVWLVYDTFEYILYIACLRVGGGASKEPALSHVANIDLFDLCVCGGWWHLNWGERACGTAWSRISGMVSNTANTWVPCVWCHSICSVPSIIMSRSPLSSLHWYRHNAPWWQGWKLSQCDVVRVIDEADEAQGSEEELIISLSCQQSHRCIMIR